MYKNQNVRPIFSYGDLISAQMLAAKTVHLVTDYAEKRKASKNDFLSSEKPLHIQCIHHIFQGGFSRG